MVRVGDDLGECSSVIISVCVGYVLDSVGLLLHAPVCMTFCVSLMCSLLCLDLVFVMRLCCILWCDVFLFVWILTICCSILYMC